MVTIRDSGPQISEAQIVHLENRINSLLPDEYRRFLLKYNGGLPEPDVVDVDGLQGGEADVQLFFGIGDPVETCDIKWNIEALSERLANLPRGLLPIACDSGGNCYMLALQGAERGTVYYCDLQSVFAVYDAIPKLYRVAASFDEFLMRLRRLVTD